MITSAENKTGAGYVQSFSLKSSRGATFHQFIILQQVLSVTHILCSDYISCVQVINPTLLTSQMMPSCKVTTAQTGRGCGQRCGHYNIKLKLNRLLDCNF